MGISHGMVPEKKRICFIAIESFITIIFAMVVDATFQLTLSEKEKKKTTTCNTFERPVAISHLRVS